MLITILAYSATEIFPTQNLPKFATPLMGLTPTQRWLWTQLCWCNSPSEFNACTLYYGFYPSSGTATQATATSPLLASLWESKPSAMGLTLVQSPYSASRILPSQSPHLIFRGWVTHPLRTRTLGYKLPSSEPTGGWTPDSFSLSCPNRIVTMLWVLSPLGVDASNLSMGHTFTAGPYQVHSSTDGSNCNTCLN